MPSNRNPVSVASIYYLRDNLKDREGGDGVAARESGVDFGRGGMGSIVRLFQAGLVDHQLSFNFGPAPLGFAIAGTHADGPAQGFKRQTAFPNGLHDRASGHTPADAHLLEVVDHLFLSVQPAIPSKKQGINSPDFTLYLI